MHTINLPYKQGYVTPVPAAVVVNTYEFREAEDPSIQIYLKVWTKLTIIHSNVLKYEEVGSKTQIIYMKLLKTDSLFLTVA